MKNSLIALAILAFSAGSAMATPGNNGGGNGGCGNGQQTNGCGSTNNGGASSSSSSSTAYGGSAAATGGTAIGTGGSATGGTGIGGSVTGSGNSSSHNTNTNAQGQQQGQVAVGMGGQGGRGGQGGQGGSASSSSNSGGNTMVGGANTSTQANTTNVSVAGDTVTYQAQERNPVNTAYAAPLAASNGTCLGSASGGLQTVGVGVSFGSTKIDEGCDARYDAIALNQLGEREAARARLCLKPEIAEAFARAGKPCKAATAAAVPTHAQVVANDAAEPVRYTDPIIRKRLGLPAL